MASTYSDRLQAVPLAPKGQHLVRPLRVRADRLSRPCGALEGSMEATGL